jgi:YHS domain-containing protein
MKIKNIATITAAAFTLIVCSCANNTTRNTNVKPYTKNNCIVTGNKLGSMGTPVTIIHEGQQVKFCCSPCMKKFKANPAKYLTKL